jgi:AcrR family transcriptional regulator
MTRANTPVFSIPEPPSTHDRLLAAAAELFAERGYGGTSMAEIAARVGVRKASLYNYYPSKDELLLELLRRSLGAWQESCLPALEAAGSTEERLWRHLRASAEFARRHGPLLAIIRLAATQLCGPLGERVEHEVVAQKRVHRQRLDRFFSEAVAAGEVAAGDAGELAYLYRAFANGVLLGYLDCNGGERPSDERLRRIWRRFWSGLDGRRPA